MKLQKEFRLQVEHPVFAPIFAYTPSRMHLTWVNDHDIARRDYVGWRFRPEGERS